MAVNPCLPNASQPKAGVVGQVVATTEAIAGVLALTGVAELPAGLLALIGAGIQFTAPAFCASPPPDDPHPTQQDLNDALEFQNPVVNFPAVAKYQQWFLSHYWYLICECAAGPQPTTPVLSPPGTWTSNPRAPVPNEPCFQNSFTASTTNITTGQVITDLTTKLIPSQGPSITGTNLVVGNNAGISAPVWPIPTSVSGFDFTATLISGSVAAGFPTSGAVGFCVTDTNGNFAGGITVGVQNPPDIKFQPVNRGAAGVWPVGATHYSITKVDSGNASFPNVPYTQTYDTVGRCTGPQLETPCCPPDPSIDQRLNQIIQYLQFLMTKQQPGASTKWTDGTRHSSLTGAGHLELVGAATAVRVEVNTIPPTVSITQGDPTFYWDLGFVTPLAIDIPLRGQRLVFNPEIFSLPPQTTGVSWSLPAGAVISIIELLPS